MILLLLPWVALAVSATVFQTVLPRRRWALAAIGVEFLAGIVLLFDGMVSDSQSSRLPTLAIGWKLPSGGFPAFLDSCLFLFDTKSVIAILLCALVAASSLAFDDPRKDRSGWSLACLGGMVAALASADLVTHSLSLAIVAIALAGRILHSQAEGKRLTGLKVLQGQLLGWISFLAGLAAIAAIASIVRSAPHGIPGKTTTVIPELARLLASSIRQHPAAQMLWEQYENLPLAIMTIATFFVAGLFPCHRLGFPSVPLSRSDRVWLTSWRFFSLFLIAKSIVLFFPDHIWLSSFWGAALHLTATGLLGLRLYRVDQGPTFQRKLEDWLVFQAFLSLIAVPPKSHEIAMASFMAFGLVALVNALAEPVRESQFTDQAKVKGSRVSQFAGWILLFGSTAIPSGWGLSQARSQVFRFQMI
ncbi:MAG: hypothetical protein KDM64_16910, partial [Verrucomicrobiae bacterium]|nr:hypothetical protein [Verrucomicrobiae bacterium]